MRRAQALTGGGLATLGLIALAAALDPAHVADAAALVLLVAALALIGPRRRGGDRP